MEWRRRLALLAGLVIPWVGVMSLAAQGPVAAPAAAAVTASTDGDEWELSLAAAADRSLQVTRSTTGMVVSSKPLASRVGAEILAKGGNAVDAAVATAFALTVVEPSMSSIGGRSQILIRMADGTFHGVDGGTQVAASYDAARAPRASSNSRGYGTIGIPGTVAGLAYALAEYGTLPLAEVMAPAIALAQDGFLLTRGEAGRMASAARALREFEGSAMHFLKADGTPHQPGERFRQPHLAWTLEQIAKDGPAEFYKGEIAQRIDADMRSNGGFLTAADLAGYAALPVRVVHGSYRGHDLVGTYSPASGATLIQILQMLEETRHRAPVESPEWISLVAQAIRVGYTDRGARLGTPEEKARTLTSREWARKRAAELRLPRPGREEEAEAEAESWYPVHESSNTTHLSVADRNGGMVAITQSIGPNFGSLVSTPGLGFIYASTHGYLSGRPGSRPSSSQAPFMVMKDGQPAFVMGAAGAARILTAQSIVLSRLIDGGQPLDVAMAAPRFHPQTQDRLELEDRAGTRWPDGTDRALTRLGFAVSTHSTPSYFARIHAIAYDPETGMWLGVADPRRDGAAIAPGP